MKQGMISTRQIVVFILIALLAVAACTPNPAEKSRSEAFKQYETMAYSKGFLMVSSTPLTRSSYHAGDDFAQLRAAREADVAALVVDARDGLTVADQAIAGELRGVCRRLALVVNKCDLPLAGRTVRRPDRTVATVDHNVPTIGREDSTGGPPDTEVLYLQRALTELMTDVVDAGTGQAARIVGASVGGKTGTAEIIKSDEDVQEVDSAWFVGVAPVRARHSAIMWAWS